MSSTGHLDLSFEYYLLQRMVYNRAGVVQKCMKRDYEDNTKSISTSALNGHFPDPHSNTDLNDAVIPDL